VTVVDDARGDATLFLEPGPQIAHEEWEALVTIYLDRLAHAKAVVLAGSLPPGVPVDAYRQLGELATKAGVPVVLDAVGEALTWGLHARPQLVKPNLSELEGFAGNRLNTEPDKLQAVEAMLEVGAEAVVVSLGDEGLLAVTIEGRWRVQPSERLTGNPTGAGDAVVSALTLGMIRGTSWPKRLADACALSMAAVKAPEAGEFDDKAYRHYQQLVRVTSF
ncbi:MAG: 1-phosphofructokinase family hexose kinase, partial [Candidatus Dormibacteraceae bacterium]